MVRAYGVSITLYIIIGLLIRLVQRLLVTIHPQRKVLEKPKVMPQNMTSLYTQLSPDGPKAGGGLVGGPADLPPLNLFEREANEVRNHRVNWQSYLQ